MRPGQLLARIDPDPLHRSTFVNTLWTAPAGPTVVDPVPLAYDN